MSRRFIVSLTLSRNFFASAAVGAGAEVPAQLMPLRVEALMATEQMTRRQVFFTIRRRSRVRSHRDFIVLPVNRAYCPRRQVPGRTPRDHVRLAGIFIKSAQAVLEP